MASVEFSTTGRLFREPIGRLATDPSLTLTDLERGGVQEVLVGAFKVIDVDRHMLQDEKFCVRVDTRPGTFKLEIHTEQSA